MTTAIQSLFSQKVCFKCKTPKSSGEFYGHPRMKDGRLGKCKECTKSDVRQNRQERLDYYTTYDKKRNALVCRVEARFRYARTPSGRAAQDRGAKKWKANNPQKRAAQNALNNALRNGHISRGKCERCGSEKVHGHHENYNKPLEVNWLCPKHHTERHKEMRLTNQNI